MAYADGCRTSAFREQISSVESCEKALGGSKNNLLNGKHVVCLYSSVIVLRHLFQNISISNRYTE
jgi:hypothetical protein